MRAIISVMLLATLFWGTQAGAVELHLSGDHYWVVLASRHDVDEAIAAAQPQFDQKAMVVTSANGWFAAISGPYVVKQGAGRHVLDGLIADHGVPKDAYFTRGESFTGIVWTPPATNVVATLSYDGEHDATLRKDDLDITLSRQKDGDDAYDAVAIGRFKGKPAFKFVVSDNPAEKPASQVSLVRLDPDSPMPQMVFSYFWQGAHCCTVTKFASLTKEGVWLVIDGETLDGGGGYGFEDIEGKGFSYLTSSDQSFYYTFDSYAGSISPLRIHQLIGGKLADVTSAPMFRHRMLQDLYGDETIANSADDNGVWHSNGFLAGWVAGSMLVDRGDAAWTKMLANYDHHSDFGPETCTKPIPIEKCPDDKKIKLAFPAALRQFLAEHGYISEPSRFAVPYEVEP